MPRDPTVFDVVGLSFASGGEALLIELYRDKTVGRASPSADSFQVSLFLLDRTIIQKEPDKKRPTLGVFSSVLQKLVLGT